MIDMTRREEFDCPDCTTPRQVFVPTSDGGMHMQVITHDRSCPWLARLTEKARQVIGEHGLVLHIEDDANRRNEGDQQ